MSKRIRVGVTDWHGAMQEAAQFAPEGVVYGEAHSVQRSKLWPLRSPIKGFMRRIEGSEFDLIEAVMSPILTDGRWVYSLAHFAEGLAFSLFGLPIPRNVRAAFIKRILIRGNCKKIIFWSAAGQDTLEQYGRLRSDELKKKCEVVYPAIRVTGQESNSVERRKDSIQLLFNGDFFRKGGAHVVDAFERIQKNVRGARLKLCCDVKRDFNTSNQKLRRHYLDRIKGNSAIELGRVPRIEMMESVFPNSDIYVLPTYAEAFGFAILEAMAYGLPVVSTNYFAIPEMVSDRETGLLVDTSKFDCDKMFPGYFVRDIPEEFHTYMSDEVFKKLMFLIDSPQKRIEMGASGLQMARSKFSFETRNLAMRRIYEEALL